jgi:hypothetical protein
MNNLIPLSQATEMTARYRAEKENILAESYKGKNLLSICETFDRAAFDQTLALPDCVKLRIYYGMDTTLKVHAIVVGVNSKDEDILPTPGATTRLLGDGDVIEEGQLCPPACPPPSALNP